MTASGMLHITRRPIQKSHMVRCPLSVVRCPSFVARPFPRPSAFLATDNGQRTTDESRKTDDQRDILAAEAEAVAQGVPNALLAGGVADVVQVALRVGRLVIP